MTSPYFVVKHVQFQICFRTATQEDFKSLMSFELDKKVKNYAQAWVSNCILYQTSFSGD
jgi:hypothetical protein